MEGRRKIANVKQYKGWGRNGTGEKGGALAQSGVVGRRVCIGGVFDRDFLSILRTRGRLNRDIVHLPLYHLRESSSECCSEIYSCSITIANENLVMPVDQFL